MREDYTAVAFIVDRSGSMSGYVDDTIGGINTFIEDQRKLEGDVSFSLVLFDDKVETPYDFVDLKEVPEVTSEVYFTRGWTSLLDAIGTTVNGLGARLAAMDEADRPSKIIVAVLTDGAENHSTEFTGPQIKEMIERQEKDYKWDFSFLSADLSSFENATQNWGFQASKSVHYDLNCSDSAYSALSSKTSMMRSCATADEALLCADFSVKDRKDMGEK
jgi:uncharacterized protein YegL